MRRRREIGENLLLSRHLSRTGDQAGHLPASDGMALREVERRRDNGVRVSGEGETKHRQREPFTASSLMPLLSGQARPQTNPHINPERQAAELPDDMKAILVALFSEFEWFRKLHGGKWMRTNVDFPVCSLLWLTVPDHATPEYREALWRGTPEFIDYGNSKQKTR